MASCFREKQASEERRMRQDCSDEASIGLANAKAGLRDALKVGSRSVMAARWVMKPAVLTFRGLGRLAT
jgi:hypothetical protein